MAIKRFLKDPDETLDYEVDWSQWLPPGDVIATHTCIPDPGIVVSTSTHTTTAVFIWVSGGAAGSSYNIVTRITTAAGRQAERTISFTVREL